MAKKRKPAASRDAIARRWALGLILLVAGLGGGALLGLLVVGSGLRGEGEKEPSFAGLSANPDALAADSGVAAEPCLNCADSYGVAARLRAEREHRMSEPIRELGAVDVDAPPPSDGRDDYHYGGRFPDPPASRAEPVVPPMVMPVAIPPEVPAPTEPPAQQKGPATVPGPPAKPE